MMNITNTEERAMSNSFIEKQFNFMPSSDLSLIYCGKRINSVSHCYHPHTRDDFIISYVLRGTALFHSGGKTHQLSKNDIFVTFPKSLANYACPKNSLWSIKWIVVRGKQIEEYLKLLGISVSNPVVKASSPEIEFVFDTLLELFDDPRTESKIACIADTHRLFSILMGDIQRGRFVSEKMQQALNLITERYCEEITVEFIADSLGYEMKYFSKLFKSQIGTSPHALICSLRMKKACRMLIYTDLPIKEIAKETGYSDQFYFHRIFKQQIGVTPSEYRKQHCH